MCDNLRSYFMTRASQPARGFILGRLPFGNTGLILRWLTPDSGRMTTMAKGAMRPRNSYGLQFDLYYLCEIEFIPARQGDMHTLKEVRLVDPYLGLRREWKTLLTLEYFGALIEEMTETGTALPDDFDLFFKAVEYLNTHSASLQLIERFEKKLLEIHGLASEVKGDFPAAIRAHHLHVPTQRGRLLREFE